MYTMTCVCTHGKLTQHAYVYIDTTQSGSDVFIFIDVKRALDGQFFYIQCHVTLHGLWYITTCTILKVFCLHADGIMFYRLTNGVVLCPGNERGVLPSQYFCEVRTLEDRLCVGHVGFFFYYVRYQAISERHYNYCKSLDVCPRADSYCWWSVSLNSLQREIPAYYSVMEIKHLVLYNSITQNVLFFCAKINKKLQTVKI